MINVEATIRWKGYSPDNLKPQSNKRVWAICGDCGKGRWVKYQDCRDLCHPCANASIYVSEETRKKMSNSQSCKHVSEKTRNKMSIARSGDKNYMYGKHITEVVREKIKNGNTGLIRSEETRNKMSIAQTGKNHSEESRMKMSAAKQGIPYDDWESFAVDHPYCPKFNEACKESNRDKYDRKCFICGLPESENITSTGKLRKLGVHHVDMNKQQGCDGHAWKLIPTCMHHHNLHSDLWIDRIVYLLNEQRYDKHNT